MSTDALTTTHTDNLPRRLTPLFGRERELVQIKTQLLDPYCRLLTLLGPGGMGKTRLALEVAATLADEFAHDVCFVNLQPLNDPAQLPTALADAVRLSLSGSASVENQLQHYLADKEMLLLLDNFEHLLDGAEFLSELLRQAPGVKALVTSREVLNLQEEWLFPLPGLACPPARFDPASLEQYAAVTLFVERMRRLRPHFVLTEEAAAVGRICRLVEGMPLALELAASWAKGLTCAEIATEIEQGIAFLGTSLRDMPARHRSMTAVFTHSWALLSPAEQNVFRRLAVFRSSFTAAAADKIAGAARVMLLSLVDKSLLRWESVGRYRLHELLRQYAAEKLGEIPQAAHEVHAAHCAFYTDFLVQRQAAVVSAQQGAVVAAIEAEIDNLRAAWDWALQCKLPAALIGMIQVLPLYYQMRGRYHEGVDAHEGVIKVFDTDSATPEEKNALLLALVFLGWLRIRLGEFAAAEHALRRCQRLYTELSLPPLPGYGTDPETPLGLIAAMRGNLDEALTLSERSHQRNVQNDHQLNLQLSHYVLCGIKQKQGLYAEARSHADAALAITEAIGDQWFMANCLIELGQVEEALGNDHMAQHHFQRSYTLREQLADRGGMALALNHLGSIAVRQQDFAHAQEIYEQSRIICAETNDRGGLAAALAGLGVTVAALGDLATARHHFHTALTLAVQIQLVSLIFSLFFHIGNLWLRTNQKARGLDLLALVRDHSASPPPLRHQAMQQLTQDQVSVPTQHSNESVESLATALLMDLAHLPSDFADSPLAPSVNSSQSPSLPAQDLVEPLTRRELEVLQLLAAGYSNQQIANHFIVAIGTVKSHTAQIYGKLGVNSRTHAIATARKLGLLDD
jgi:predicted ATPase/DNA-binding CsgD family transcriptional regulator